MTEESKAVDFRVLMAVAVVWGAAALTAFGMKTAGVQPMADVS